MPAICIHDWLNECKKKSKLIRSGYYVFSGRGEFLNCLCCSALALLLHSSIIWPIQHPTRTEKGFAEFLNQKRWHPRSILGAKEGGGCQCGTQSEMCLRTWWATGCSFSITIGSGASLPLNSHRKESKKKKKQMCGSERVALNPTHFKSPLDSVN